MKDAEHVGSSSDGDEEHAVIVHIGMSSAWGSARERLRLWRLERRLEKAIERADVGELDGNEIGEEEAVFYMYGPDRDRLWQAVEPVLRSSDVLPAYALLRAGGPDAESERVDL